MSKQYDKLWTYFRQILIFGHILGTISLYGHILDMLWTYCGVWTYYGHVLPKCVQKVSVPTSCTSTRFNGGIYNFNPEAIFKWLTADALAESGIEKDTSTTTISRLLYRYLAQTAGQQRDFRDFLSSDRPVIKKPGSHLNSNSLEGNTGHHGTL